MHSNALSRILPCLALILSLAPALDAAKAQAGIHPLWDKYLNIYEDRRDLPELSFQGRIVGDWTERPEKQFMDAWPYRGATYEILCATGKDLARLIYGLALHTHDLDPSVDLGRFERGAQGFHYSTDQIAAWANDVLAGTFPLHTAEELAFLGWLTEDGILELDGGAVRPGDGPTHVLGAAPGKRRSMEFNLRHERLHVMWDEDDSFRQEFTGLWETLSEEEHEAVFEDLSGYDRTNLPNIIEEWAVRSRESETGW